MPAADRDAPSTWAVVLSAAFVPAVGFALGMIRSSSPKSLDGVWELSALLAAVAGLFYWHPYRGTGFVPYLLTLAAGAGIWAAVAGAWCAGTIGVAAACLGLTLTFTGLFLVRQNREGGWVVAVLLVLISWTSARPHNVPDGVPVTDFAAFAAVLCAFAWYWFFRPWFELNCEPVLWWMYRIRAAGPGVGAMPAVGPCLVVANHAAWLDPLFLAKVLPRRTTPMMTAKFYDKPVIGWLMRRFGVIRVPEKALKQDTPELREAVAALDRGECVVIFPEGFLRRSEDRPLKRFGRGVWQILTERPDTPVFNCWIEGAWGSYCSYSGGPPTKNKKRDRRRPIGVAVSAPLMLPTDVLANHLRTRVFLMNCVLGARAHLRLPVLPAVELPASDED